MLKKKNKKLVSEKAYQTIKEMIYRNRFKRGLRLNIERLSREFGVSRTPVWEAIRRLEEEGIVHKQPNRGVFLVEISLERVLEQMIVLNALDRLAGRLACERMNANILEKLSEYLPEQLQSIESEDLVHFGLSELQFHRAIYEATGLSYLVEIFDSITIHLIPSDFNFLPALTRVYLTHEELIEGFRDRDIDKVLKAVNRHTHAYTDEINKQIKLAAKRKEMVHHLKKRLPLIGQNGTSRANGERGL